MNFKNKISQIFGTVCTAIKSAFRRAKGFVLAHKKESLIVAAVLVAFVVILAIAFSFSKPKRPGTNGSSVVGGDSSSANGSSVVSGDSSSANSSSSSSSSEPLTESQIEEIGDWWNQYIEGDNIVVEGNKPIEK